MVRQARTYFVGAISGVTLIGVAIAVFVVLVSAQVFKDWPIAALGGGDDKAAVSDANEVAGPAESAASTPKVRVPASAAGADAARATGGPGNTGAKPHGNQHAAALPQADVSPSDVPVAPSGSESAPSETGSETGGGPSHPAPSNPSPGSSPASSSPASSTPASSSPSNSTGSSSGGSKGGTGTGTSKPQVEVPSVPSAPPPTSTAVTGTVNGVVNGVDETVTGGALKESGVTGVTEGVVNGVAGPESTVGKVVDETVGTVGGLLGGKK